MDRQKIRFRNSKNVLTQGHSHGWVICYKFKI